jgi:hypothetical protein
MQVFVLPALTGRSLPEAPTGTFPALRSLLRRTLGLAVGVLLLPESVAAHGDVPHEPTIATLWEGWSFEPDVWLPIIVAALAYWLAWRL